MGDVSASRAVGQALCVGLATGSMRGSRNRVNFYPAAPFRLATLLTAWIITEHFGQADMEPRIRPTNAPCPDQDVGPRRGWTAPHPGGRDLLRRTVNFSSAICDF